MRRGPDWSLLSGTFRWQLSKSQMPEDARSSLRFRLQTVKDELYSQDPLPLRVSKVQSAIARTEASLAKKEKALFASKQERDKARCQLDEIEVRPTEAHSRSRRVGGKFRLGRWIIYMARRMPGRRMDPHPGVVPAMCLGIITPRTIVRRVLTTAIRRLLA